MRTLLFKESPLLVLYVTLIFGVVDQLMHNRRRYHAGVAFTLYIGTLGALMYFYRIPERVNRYPEEFIVAPSDGVVKSVLRVDVDTMHIAIYLNIFDAHIQWCPLAGQVVSQRRKAGRFHPAYLLEKSRYNERVETTIYNPNLGDTVKVVQIAGQVARRISTFVSKGTRVARGDLLGLIKLSSRVDLFLPSDRVKVFVQEGDRLQGNKTLIGEIL